MSRARYYSNAHRKAAEDDLSEGNHQLPLRWMWNETIAAFIKYRAVSYCVHFTCDARKEKRKELTFLIRIICHFAGSKTHRLVTSTPHVGSTRKTTINIPVQAMQPMPTLKMTPERMAQAKHWQDFSCLCGSSKQRERKKQMIFSLFVFFFLFIPLHSIRQIHVSNIKMSLVKSLPRDLHIQMWHCKTWIFHSAVEYLPLVLSSQSSNFWCLHSEHSFLFLASCRSHWQSSGQSGFVIGRFTVWAIAQNVI